MSNKIKQSRILWTVKITCDFRCMTQCLDTIDPALSAIFNIHKKLNIHVNWYSDNKQLRQMNKKRLLKKYWAVSKFFYTYVLFKECQTVIKTGTWPNTLSVHCRPTCMYKYERWQHKVTPRWPDFRETYLFKMCEI